MRSGKYRIYKTNMSSGNVPEKLQDLFRAIIQEEWTFLDDPWPMAHRSEFKVIKGMRHMKLAVMSKLGAVAVYFFLTVLWNKVYFPVRIRHLKRVLPSYTFLSLENPWSPCRCSCPGLPSTRSFAHSFKEERSLSTRKWQGASRTIWSNPKH
ncbi:LOW QUALITY PROTEIN: hypothetical protein BKA57DRAFT_480348, partial [Linnemannia elongata]